MKFYIKSAQDGNRNFTNPVSLHEGMQVKESSDGEVLTVKSSVKKGNAWEVTFDNGDCFMYDPNEQFEVITSDTKLGKDFDVFMLMEYTADTGPDTTGMEGDTFNCLGKFFSKDLATAKEELKRVQAKHPGLEHMCYDLYVTEYNSYFDNSSDDPADYYDADNNVFPDLETLVEYGFDQDYLDNYDKYAEDSQELPFDPTYVPEDNFLRNCVNKALDIVELDPDYADDIATIRYSYNAPNGTYDIIIYFEDGDTIEHSFVIDKIIKLDDDQVSEGARIISNELYGALKAAGR